jgi:transcriptional regulator with XRE-family HTH domain
MSRGFSMINNKLREKRLELGLSQVELSYLTKVPSVAISDFELGKRVPWPKARRALAQALRLPEAELFPDGGEKNK